MCRPRAIANGRVTESSGCCARFARQPGGAKLGVYFQVNLWTETEVLTSGSAGVLVGESRDLQTRTHSRGRRVLGSLTQEIRGDLLDD